MKISPILFNPAPTLQPKEKFKSTQKPILKPIPNDSVSFKGLPSVNVPTLTDKISNLIEILHSNEVLLVGRNFKQSIKDLQQHIDALPQLGRNVYSPFRRVIKKILFIEDKTAPSMAFTRNQGKKEYTNLGEQVTWILDNKKEKYFVKQQETAYFNNQDSILTYDGLNLDFSKAKTFAPNKLKEDYVFTFDKTKEAETKIQQVNKGLLRELFAKKQPKRITFKDIGGMDPAIQEIKETIVYPLKYPELATKMNKAVLLEGPPGTGKSLLAEATANETNASFIHIKGSELDSKFVGESEKNVRSIVDQARQTQPTIIFIDEMDAIAKSRSGRDVYGDKVLNTWLAEMSECEKRGDEVYFIAATNNVSSLDNAMTRAGRFGKIIHIGEPDEKGIKQIFDIYSRNVKLDKNLNIEKVIKDFHQRKATGADIAAGFEDAQKFAMRRTGIYDKLENGTFSSQDMRKLVLNNEDFDKAMEQLEQRKKIQNETSSFDDLEEQIKEYKQLNKERRELIEKLKAQQDFKNRPRIGFTADRYKS